MTIFAFCKPMKAMNRPMPTLTAFFRSEGDGVEDSLPDIEQGQKDEDQSFCQDGRQSHLPGIAHAQDHRIGKIGV